MAKTNAARALAVNSIQNDDIVIPLGIATKYSGGMNIELYGMDRYNAVIIFIDLEEDKEFDITDFENFVYNFTHTAILDIDDNGAALENRFFLRFTPEITSMNTYSEKGIAMYVSEDEILVLSPTGDNIKEILLYDVNGQLLHQNYRIDANHYKLPHNLRRSLGVLKVQTQKRSNVFKLIK